MNGAAENFIDKPGPRGYYEDDRTFLIANDTSNPVSFPGRSRTNFIV
jgi:hypothetical protein